MPRLSTAVPIRSRRASRIVLSAVARRFHSLPFGLPLNAWSVVREKIAPKPYKEVITDCKSTLYWWNLGNLATIWWIITTLVTDQVPQLALSSISTLDLPSDDLRPCGLLPHSDAHTPWEGVFLPWQYLRFLHIWSTPGPESNVIRRPNHSIRERAPVSDALYTLLNS